MKSAVSVQQYGLGQPAGSGQTYDFNEMMSELTRIKKNQYDLSKPYNGIMYASLLESGLISERGFVTRRGADMVNMHQAILMVSAGTRDSILQKPAV
jgi:hypothetical protein